MRVHERLDTFRGEARFSTWLYRLAYNRTIERRRRARLRAEHVPCESLEAAADVATGPLEAALERERERAVARLIEGLPDVVPLGRPHALLDGPVDRRDRGDARAFPPAPSSRTCPGPASASASARGPRASEGLE